MTRRPNAPSKVQRWLDLVLFLLGRNDPVPVADILRAVGYVDDASDEAAVESARRMFERDKEELRALGIPIVVERRTVHYGRDILEGYRIDERSFYLPVLRILEHAAAEQGDVPRPGGVASLSSDDLREAVRALRDLAANSHHPFAPEALRVLRKLTFDAPADAGTGTSPILLDPESSTAHATLLKLTHALRHRQAVVFRYHGAARGHATERYVYPYGLGYRHGQWYLLGWDRERNAVRTFRISRIERLRTVGSTAAYSVPSNFRVADYLRRHPWELGDDSPRAVEVLFPLELAPWLERNRYGEPVSAGPHGVRRRFDVRSVEPLLRWLLGLGQPIRIETPDDVAQMFRDLVESTLARYAEP